MSGLDWLCFRIAEYGTILIIGLIFLWREVRKK